ncbi:hypothetical protein EJ07DRAFT_158555 [Lizonia empirigonia]|nr:hypothetical protein EJ07DRAFT_158555 [Lizonia empirigonia]
MFASSIMLLGRAPRDRARHATMHAFKPHKAAIPISNPTFTQNNTPDSQMCTPIARSGNSMMRAKHERDHSPSDPEHPLKRQTIHTRLRHSPLPATTSNSSAAIKKLNEKHVVQFEEECRKAMTDDVEVDLGPLFQSYGSKYSGMREVVNARRSQSTQC